MNEPMNFTWIAPSITAFAGLVASVAAAVMAYLASKRSAAAEANAIAAKENAAAAKEQAIDTFTRVDGRMEEMLKLVKDQAASEATLKEKEAEAARKATQSAIANGLAAGAAVSTVATAQEMQRTAAELAKKLVDDAAVAAAKLLAEANRQGPAPVKIVEGHGVDVPLKVKG